MSVLGVEQQAQARPDDGVVVDDQHADRGRRHRSGTSATIVVPEPSAGLDREPTAEEPDALAHADEAEPAVARSAGAEAPAVVLDDRGHRRRRAGVRTMLTCVASRVLGDVGERLLDDPVERGLDLGRQPVVADGRLEVDRDPRLLGERLASRSSAGTRPKSSSACGPKLDREPADVLQRRRRAAAAAPAAASRASSSVGRVLDPLQAEQDRGQRLAGLVVQLAREPRALELLRLDDAAERVARDAVGEVDGDRARARRTSRRGGGRPR